MPLRTAWSLASALLQRIGAPGEVALETQRGAAKLKRLGVENLGFFGGKQFVGLRTELLADLGIGVEALGGDGVDLRAAWRRRSVSRRLGQGLVELRSAPLASPWLSWWIAR